MPMPSSSDPTTQWEQTHRVLAQSYFPHSLRPLSATSTPNPNIKHVKLGGCETTYMSLGAPASLSSDHPGAYAINITMTGQLDCLVNGVRFTSAAGTATVCPPDTPMVIPRWESSCSLLGLKLDKRVLDRELELVLGRRPESFANTIDLTTSRGNAWLRMLRSISREVADTRGDGIWLDPRMGSQMSSTIITGLILAAYPESEGDRRGLRPAAIRRVTEAMEADPARAWSPGELAETAGVGVRRLQQTFREYSGLTPFQFLREVRIQRARADLVADDPDTTVSEIAHRWGITHLGRFAQEYRERFGESPSMTLGLTRD